MHRRPLQHERQVTFPAKQGLDPVDHAQHRLFADAPLFQPMGRALQQAHQASTGIIAQRLDPRVARPFGQAFADTACKDSSNAIQIGRFPLPVFTVAAFAFPVAAQQGVELLCHHFPVRIQVCQKCTRMGITQGLCDPLEVVVPGGQHMGLLVVQVLDTVFHLTQKNIGRAQRMGCDLGHEPRFGDTLQGVQGGAGAQLGELPATNHLQKLNGEFDLANAATRQLDIIGALGSARTPLGRVFANLLMQRAQRLEHVVVEVTAKHKGQNHPAHGLGRAIDHRTAGRDHPAFHPRKTLPLSALHQQILLQGIQRDHAGAGVAVGPEGQIHPKNKAVVRGVANQGVHALNGAGEVFLARHLVAAFAVAQRFPVFVVHINQVNVTGHIQLTGAQLAHAEDPHFSALAIGLGGRTMQDIQIGHDLLPGDVEGDFGQPGHALHHHVQ